MLRRVIVMRFCVAARLPFVLGILVCLGCGQNTDQRLAQVQKRQSVIDERIAADEKRAAELRSEVKQLEQTVDLERSCLARQECWMQLARVNAFVAKELAECNRHSANWFACDAERTRNKAEGTGLGCLVGWGFAVLTGGSAAPAIAIGCGLGAKRGESNTVGHCMQQSRPEACGARQAAFTEAALASLQLTNMPTCEPVPPECGSVAPSSY
jgi:hypothetical protein